MATQRELSRPEATSSAASFARYLRAANIAPATLKLYAEAVRTLAAFFVDRGMPTDVAVIIREHAEAFITAQLARWRPATAANRYRGLQRFFAWLVEDGEIRVSPMARADSTRSPDFEMTAGHIEIETHTSAGSIAVRRCPSASSCSRGPRRADQR